jgi:hypothetical protein
MSIRTSRSSEAERSDHNAVDRFRTSYLLGGLYFGQLAVLKSINVGIFDASFLYQSFEGTKESEEFPPSSADLQNDAPY